MSDENYTWEINAVETTEIDPNTPKMLELFRVPISQKLINYYTQPINCGPASRMFGARKARGKYLIFMDAHSEVGKNTVPKLISLLENDTCDEVHGTTLKTHYVRYGGSHYKLFGNGGPNLNTHFHGSYSRPTTDKPYKCVNANLAYVAFRTKEFLDNHGYNDRCRFYPHPEGYLPLKYLMFGKRVMVHPDCFHFHSNYPRNYGTKIKEEGYVIKIQGDDYKLVGQDFLIRNAMLCASTLGGEKWLNILRDSWLAKVASRYVVNGIADEAWESSREEREWVEKNAKYTLDEVLTTARKEKVAGTEVWFDPIGEDPLK